MVNIISAFNGYVDVGKWMCTKSDYHLYEVLHEEWRSFLYSDNAVEDMLREKFGEQYKSTSLYAFFRNMTMYDLTETCQMADMQMCFGKQMSCKNTVDILYKSWNYYWQWMSFLWNQTYVQATNDFILGLSHLEQFTITRQYVDNVIFVGILNCDKFRKTFLLSDDVVETLREILRHECNNVTFEPYKLFIEMMRGYSRGQIVSVSALSDLHNEYNGGGLETITNMCASLKMMDELPKDTFFLLSDIRSMRLESRDEEHHDEWMQVYLDLPDFQDSLHISSVVDDLSLHKVVVHDLLESSLHGRQKSPWLSMQANIEDYFFPDFIFTGVARWPKIPTLDSSLIQDMLNTWTANFNTSFKIEGHEIRYLNINVSQVQVNVTLYHTTVLVS